MCVCVCILRGVWGWGGWGAGWVWGGVGDGVWRVAVRTHGSYGQDAAAGGGTVCPGEGIRKIGCRVGGLYVSRD